MSRTISTSAARSPCAEQLGADLQHLARPAAALGLLPVHRAGVAQPERQRGVGERGGGDAREAGREIVPEREDAAVTIGKADQPLGDVRSAGAEEGVLILEASAGSAPRRPPRSRAAIAARCSRAPATGGLAREVERTGRCDGVL